MLGGGGGGGGGGVCDLAYILLTLVNCEEKSVSGVLKQIKARRVEIRLATSRPLFVSPCTVLQRETKSRDEQRGREFASGRFVSLAEI